MPSLLPQGYTGFLCGACDAGYGRSWSFECVKCYQGYATTLLLIASFFMLFLLSGFTIRSNLNERSETGHHPTNRISRRNRRLVPSTRRISTNFPGKFEMVEMTHQGEEEPEDARPDPPATSSRNNTSKSDPTIAKRTVVEIFKAESSSDTPFMTLTGSVG